jgi:hypothetical protein
LVPKGHPEKMGAPLPKFEKIIVKEARKWGKKKD